ncbi:hypothetical protein [Haloferula sp. BvORR071]|uniref:hypothetical protein n=1 Tax=Haloferula sp. BvORR071 TaxID=1396141 RepID=UPI0005541F4B|nr:hypothetical protein [Haloferula sp. BvORR071]
MNSAITRRCLVLLLGLAGMAGADEIRIYRVKLKGPAPELPQLRAGLDPKTAFSGSIGADGKFDIDQTDPTVASPDPEAKEPRRLGIRITGQLSAVEQDPPKTRIRMRFRECRIVQDKYAKGDKLWYPRWTENMQEELGRLDEDGWVLLDSLGEDGKAREAYVVALLREPH